MAKDPTLPDLIDVADLLENPQDYFCQECGADDGDYRRGYMQGYIQAVEDFYKTNRKQGFIRPREVYSMLLRFGYHTLAFWRYRQTTTELIFPPDFRPESWDAIRRRILARDKRCSWCGSTEKLEVDHIEPVCEGGVADDDNLRALCEPCHINRSRRAK